VFFYHFPEVTGLKLTPRELASIAEIDGVVGAKLTIVNRPYLQAAIKATRRSAWKVFVGPRSCSRIAWISAAPGCFARSRSLALPT